MSGENRKRGGVQNVLHEENWLNIKKRTIIGVLFAAYATVPSLRVSLQESMYSSQSSILKQMELPHSRCICVLLSMPTSLLAKSDPKPFYIGTDFSLRALILFKPNQCMKNQQTAPSTGETEEWQSERKGDKHYSDYAFSYNCTWRWWVSE